MGLFSCKVCAEKEKRIKDLKEQISSLKDELQPIKSGEIPLITREIDQVLSGDQEIHNVSEENLEEYKKMFEQAQEATDERDKILGGSY